MNAEIQERKQPVSRFKELPFWKRASTLGTLGLSLISACSGNTTEPSTTTTPPTTIESSTTTTVPEPITTIPPTTTTPTTVPETTPTTEPCPIIESSRQNFWGDIPADLGIIHKYENPNGSTYILINGKVNGIGQVDVENFGDTGETHSVSYVELNFGNSGEGEDCKPVLIKIGLGSGDYPYSAIDFVKYDGTRDFKSSSFHARVEGITQELIDYINDMQQRDIEVGVSLVTKAPSSGTINGSWCNDTNDPYHSMCIYNIEQDKSIERNNDLINALKEFKDSEIFPFDSLDLNAIYFAADFRKLDHSNP